MVAKLPGVAPYGKMPDKTKGSNIVKGFMGSHLTVMEADPEGKGKRTYAIGLGKTKMQIASASVGEAKKWKLKRKGLPKNTWGAAWNLPA